LLVRNLLIRLCTGGELFDKIKKQTSFNERLAANYMREIFSSVIYLHQNNIVHRDLKPENILLESNKANSSLKIIDFGTSGKFTHKKNMR